LIRYKLILRMRFIYTIAFIGLLSFIGVQQQNSDSQKREDFQAFLENHPYSNRTQSDAEIEAMPKYDRPDLAFEQNFLATLDPAVGRPTPEVLYPVIAELNNAKNTYKTQKTSSTTWVERGPTNVGGRTRAIMFDPNDSTHKRVWAGGVAGGLWYNDDISLFSSSWQNVDDFWANMAISSITYDPTNTQVFYVGTGEGYGNLDAVRGNGIWKSTDGGTTWAQLTSTSSSAVFNYVNHIKVSPVNGDVYASTRTGGLQRSQDGGTTWTKVLGSGAGGGSNTVYSIAITDSGTVWAASRGSGIYKSYTGNANSFTKLNTTSNGFNPAPSTRIELALAPNDSNICYVVSISSGKPKIFGTKDGGLTWTSKALPNDADFGIPANDYTRGQSWYDLSIAVSPTDSNQVIVGGVDIFQSKDGGSSWTQLTHWYGGFQKQYAHADQHNIVFSPYNSNEIMFSHDGGISYSPSINATTPVIVTRIKDYNTTQFYACAAHPSSGSNYFLAGAQDNGTQQFSQPGAGTTTEATGGDGAFCFIDQDNPNWQLTSYVRNNQRFSNNGGLSFTSLGNDNTGSFINPGDYDDNMNILYSHRTASTIKRIFIDGTVIPTTDDFSVVTSGITRHIKVSPYTTSSSTLFVGTSNGKVYKITGANGFSPSTSNISSILFPTGSVSCIAVGNSENELLATFSNYGVKSVWYTNNGGTTWKDIEGNLPNMPVRWALFNPNNFKEAIIATELGVWQCLDITATLPVWTAINTGLANVRVDMLQLRDIDGTVAAATHARGLFTVDIFQNPNPVAKISVHREILCVDEELTFDNVSFNATGYNWSITPNTFSFEGGTSATSKNPIVKFTALGNYNIEMIATNALGADTLTSQLTVGSLPLPFHEDFASSGLYKRWRIDNIDGDLTWEERLVQGQTTVSMQNFNYAGASILTQTDDLISPPLDFTGVDYPVLNFDYAYAKRQFTSDSLGIFYSINCGETWHLMHMMKEDGTGSFITVPPRNFSFSPTTNSQWCGNGNNANCGYVDLSIYAANKKDVRIMFRNYSNFGNNLYLGNIDITGSTIGLEERKIQGLKVFPNPAKETATIDFGKEIDGNVTVQIIDIAGRTVKNTNFNGFAGNKLNVNLSGLSSGTYLLSVQTNNQQLSTRLMIQ